MTQQPFEIDMHSEFLRADLFLAMGQPTEAARILERVVAAEPTNEAALELLARAYFGSAQLAKSEGALTRLVQLAPANGWANDLGEWQRTVILGPSTKGKRTLWRALALADPGGETVGPAENAEGA